jgi:hypothetical protein
MAATSIGIFVLARPFRTAVGFSPAWWTQVAGTFLSGLGIGVLQFLVLRRFAARPWRWIITNTIANFVGVVGSVVFGILLYPVLSLIPGLLSINLAALSMSVAFGFVFGYVTSIPIDSMFGPKAESDRRARIDSETTLN